jgi:sugar/nucleoside kinase (ribokinase family)
LAASYFVDKINLVSVVGDDFSPEFLSLMKKRGINQEGLQIKAGEKSFFWSGKYHYDMNTRDTLETQLNVLEKFKPIIPESYQECDFLMLGNLAPSVQLEVINQLRKKPAIVVLDTMNFWMNVAMEDLKTVLKKVDILTINDEEARQLSGEYSLVRAAKRIIEMGPKYLIVKKGEHGALLFDSEKMFFAPALPIEDVLDPTGAGDTFAGGFIGYLSQTKNLSFENLKRAIIIGSAMASFTVEKFGTERLIELNKEEIDDRVQLFVELVDFDFMLIEK